MSSQVFFLSYPKTREQKAEGEQEMEGEREEERRQKLTFPLSPQSAHDSSPIAAMTLVPS